MKRATITIILVLALGLLLAACGGGSDTTADSGETAANAAADSGNEAASEGGGTNPGAASDETAAADPAATNAGGNGGGLAALFSGDEELSAAAKLALGTLQLEETDYPVSEEQAATLLPLWQAYSSLASSDTAAAVELDAVLNQIRGAMTAEQSAALDGMTLDAESLPEMMANGAAGLGGDFAGGQAGGDNAGNGGGGFPGGFGGGPGGFAGAPGGFGGGQGIPGGGPGGLGGGPGVFGGEIDEDALATRQAEIAGGDFQERFLVNMVVNSLAVKTGEVVEDGRGYMRDVLAEVAAAAGMDEAALQEALAAGKTPAQVVTENGGDLEALRSRLLEMLADTPLAENQDVEEWVAGFLGSVDEGD